MANTDSVQHTKLTQRGNKFEASFQVDDCVYSAGTVTKISQKYIICGLVIFQVKVDIFKFATTDTFLNWNYIVSVNFSKCNEPDQQVYKINFSSSTYSLQNKMFLVDDVEWCQIFQTKDAIRNTNSYGFHVTFDMDVMCTRPGIFATMHDDKDLTDFELCGENGSVKVHKAIMAGYSPTLRALFNGEWKETSTGSVQVANTTVTTLQHLKDYVYLQKLPDQGIKKLLTLASYYMMSDLQQKCSAKLLSDISAENYVELLEYAVKHEIKYLLAALLEYVHGGPVSVREIIVSCPFDKSTIEPKQEID